jgi:hypothetical protein
MRKRWCAAGLLRAESKFRRVRGCRAMPTLLKALETLVREQRAGSKQRVACRCRRGNRPHFNYRWDNLALDVDVRFHP